MGKIAAIVPRNMINIIQRKSFVQTPTPIAANKRQGPTFGFASQLQSTTGAEENRIVDRFVGQL